MLNKLKSLIKKLLPSFALGWYHFGLAFWGAVLFGFPGKRIKVIGVTGTNGKSTTIEFISKIFEEAKIPIAFQSSIRFKIKEKEWPNAYKMTMPGRFFIQKFLKQAVGAKCQYAILEVTSEGIKQHRHRFINFDTVVFTNLSPEHIEAHGSFDNYKAAKGELFKAGKNIHIINSDDQHADYFLKFPAKKIITFGLQKGDINGRALSLSLKLPGAFNIYNALAAISVGWAHGIGLHACKNAVEKIDKIPGRMELVASEPFKVFVDYAFTPNALEKVYQTLKTDKPESNKLICVLGACGGGRDKWKRPVLGQIAAKYCQEIIVTNEDPYDEDPSAIINAVAVSAPKAEKILDRREAITRALSLANPGDKVILTGKGSETWIVGKNGKKTPWDERQVVLEEISKFKNR
jgi:UDP-N-acetylmuramoyl-L-alanyl-D-glutamate--2,6-diaminopimelate ligase